MAERIPPGAEHGAGYSGCAPRAGAPCSRAACRPSSQVMVSSRLVESSGTISGTRISASSWKINAVEPRVARLEIVIELLAQPRRDLLQHLRGLDRRAHAAMDRKQHAELSEVGLDRRLHVRILQLGGERARHRGDRARCTWPSEADAAASCSKLANFASQSGPSSAAMRRRTNGQPIGGAWLWSWPSSAAYSAGSASGMVASSCATFMIGPFSPPSAAASAAASLSRSGSSPNRRRPAMRAATPPTLAPTLP